jgi:hypothetical protein
MRLQKLSIFLFIFFALFCNKSTAFFQTEVFAEGLTYENGKCAIPTLVQAKKSAAHIFVGKITGETAIDDGKSYQFKVEKYWKGKKVKTITININENSRYQSWFEVGKKYLIFAETNSTNGFTVKRCSRSNEFSEASDDIKSLGKGKKIR